MIRRILHELPNVRTLARDVKRRAARAFQRNFFLAFDRADGCIVIGRGRSQVGAGYVLGHAGASDWPDHARLLTIGRVTLAAWGGRSL